MASHAWDDSRPLVADRTFRALGAFCLAVGMALAAALGAALVLFDGWPSSAAAPLAAGACAVPALAAVLAAWVTELGRWAGGAGGRIQRAAVALVALTCAAALLGGAAGAVLAARDVVALGERPAWVAPWLLLAAAGAAGLGVLACGAPLPVGRRALRRSAATLGALSAAGLVAGTAAGVAAPSGCAAFDFDADRWRSVLAAGGGDALTMAEGVERCGVVRAGTSRARVAALLGPQTNRDGWLLRQVPSFWGPADGSLRIAYDERGRVERLSVYVPD